MHGNLRYIKGPSCSPTFCFLPSYCFSPNLPLFCPLTSLVKYRRAQKERQGQQDRHHCYCSGWENRLHRKGGSCFEVWHPAQGWWFHSQWERLKKFLSREWWKEPHKPAGQRFGHGVHIQELLTESRESQSKDHVCPSDESTSVAWRSV